MGRFTELAELIKLCYSLEQTELHTRCTMRLLDRLLSFPFNPGRHDMADLREGLDDAQLVVADNVVRYVEQFKADDTPKANDFPNVMLPFEHTFIAMRYPSNGLFGNVEESGTLLTMRKASDNEWCPDPQSREWISRPGVHYNLIGDVFMHYRGSEIPFLLSSFVVGVNKDGELVSDRDDGLLDMMCSSHQDGVNFESVAQMSGMIMVPCALALSFMHCNNVMMVRESPPLPLSRKHERRTGRPLIRYHILQIDHMKQVLEREGHASTGGLSRALSLCRGHFVRYGVEGRKGLLFGKLRGRFWVPMQVRGNPQRGIVDKGYDVK